VYTWIWRKLPGGRSAKLASALLLIAAVSAVLLFVVFPWIEPSLPFNDITVE